MLEAFLEQNMTSSIVYRVVYGHSSGRTIELRAAAYVISVPRVRQGKG